MYLICLDDDPRLEATLQRFAKQLGHRLGFHTHSRSFKAELEWQEPDLVLLDLQLGRESGIDIINWLADRPAKVPLVLLSGHSAEVLETARRIARSAGLEVRGIVGKADLVRDLPPLLGTRPRCCRLNTEAPPTANVAISAELLERYIGQNRIEPYFQPIVGAADSLPRSAEVLARLRLPDGTVASADSFIPLAEASGLMVPLTQALFARLAQLRDRLTSVPLESLSVNVSTKDLQPQRVGDLVRGLIGAMDGYCAIQVELTETGGADNFDQVRELAAQLRLVGASLAMDDFGSGYASLKALADLPFDTVKLDLTFTASIWESEKSRKLIPALVMMCHGLGIKMIAEGVETDLQRRQLRAAGVDRLQGFLFGHPMPIDAFLAACGEGASAPSLAFVI
ncbi:MAG: EAL domain-containing protein [Thiohalocapsa sp.]|nr:EAL domain-containing protein [Thiohalocapsa sp.]MCF7990520.1 EAL domain-containing protein [Thiohalocapsa sp.]